MRLTRLTREALKHVLSPKQMHRILGSTDETSVEHLRELYLSRVREIHPDTRADDAPDIDVQELKDIYDKLLERRVELESKGTAAMTIEDYRAGKHHKKAKFQNYFHQNAIRFWILIPVMVIITEHAYKLATDFDGRRMQAVTDREDMLYMRAIAEYRFEQETQLEKQLQKNV